MEQRTAAYRLDRKSSVWFYFWIIFDLMDIVCVKSYLIYNMKHPKLLSLFDYKIFVLKKLIQYSQGRKKSVPMSRPSKRKNQLDSIDNQGGHLPDYQTMWKRCVYCAIEGKENRTTVICLACNTLSCLIKEKNVSKASHLGVHIMYTLYIFVKMLWFFVWFLYISTASLSFLYM